MPFGPLEKHVAVERTEEEEANIWVFILRKYTALKICSLNRQGAKFGNSAQYIDHLYIGCPSADLFLNELADRYSRCCYD